ncbi:MAG: MerR family transcriptional regulator [Candidatus Kapabacteria bacterium]|nr:MerR family transcriptional regulator [Candidatus Kapabacteria bacterium]
MQKIYYSIKEVGELVDEEAHVLRYWEKEVKQLKPGKNRSGNRTYSEKDISLLKLIKKLIREDRKNMKEVKEYIDDLYKKNSDWDNSLFFDYDIDKLTEDSEIAEIVASAEEAETEKSSTNNRELVKFLNKLVQQVKEL